ncbi:RNA polymerase, sigma-24 subunit, ECF subfamily [Kribbella flavida DSM 17836]|uniref:RNA polymerase, sigma-24 subunit, ECF subfamily n=1 Tax=Kribbella flavida (strain DSM 17836 / JCM 10339 / NBRC 14399) TaxID=479435 RepID=D2PZC4_KRIFD|nr:SigE family RNA polymerase sigma factor [Kribbella flavida]ADB33733.1 RNA polymerase, sigma-24 subunit, ECF subfamily [Kribbella flavida DSM 17836]
MSVEDEFAEYVHGHYGRMLRTARLLTGGDVHGAEDLVQTACTKLYLHWDKLRQDEGAGPYADRILVNTFIDERRRFWWRRETPTADLLDAAPAQGPDPAVRLTLQAALRQLPRRQRAVVVLRYFQDLDVATVAAVMECSEGTVKSQTARALGKLRDLVDDPLETLERVR